MFNTEQSLLTLPSVAKFICVSLGVNEVIGTMFWRLSGYAENTGPENDESAYKIAEAF